MNDLSSPGRRSVLALLAALPVLSHAQSAPKVFVEVWKDEGCGCCKDWVKHLEANGFAVKTRDGGNTAIRQKLGMPVKYGSCHTALVGGYAIEGHVPAADIRRLVKDKPQAVGLSVPGMPIGSPSMDGPEYGKRRDPYDVVLVLKTGEARVFSSYNKA